jgi:hypothetical protein
MAMIEAEAAEAFVKDGERQARATATNGESGASGKEALVELATGLESFVDERDLAFARFEVNGHIETWPIDSRRFRSWLSQKYYQQRKKVVPQAVVTDALATIDGLIRYRSDTERIRLHNRFAWHDGCLWYDLADEMWRAVRIGVDGWEIVDEVPALFRRHSHQLPQVEPEPSGDLSPFLQFLNVTDPTDQLLVLVWSVTALLPDVPRAVLIVHGPQGSAKSMMTKFLRQMVDPSSVPMPRFPRGDDEMALVLDHHAMIGFDNASVLRDHVSDTLCRAVTGDGFSKRKLYSDDTDVIRAFKRAIVLNGINVPATRPDLLDRSILVKLNMIPEGQRREERELDARFEALRPVLFGAALTTLSRAMAMVEDVVLPSLPRMADWTRWGYAVAEVIGCGGTAFLDAYSRNRRAQNREALTGHLIGAAVAALMDDRADWQGTPSTLLDELNRIADRDRIDTRQKSWPKDPSWLTRRLNEVETVLQAEGIEFERGHGKDRLIRVWKTNGPANGVDGVDGVEEHLTTGEDHDGTAAGRPDGVEIVSAQIPVRNKGFDSNDTTDGIPHSSFAEVPSALWEEDDE